MMTRARGAAIVLALGLGVALAQDKKPGENLPAPTPGIWVSEVDSDPGTGAVQILINVGKDAGIDRGDDLDVERDGRRIARATVIASYFDTAIASIDQVEQGESVARGDWVRARGKPRGPRPAEGPIAVVKDGETIALDAGVERGLRKGNEATVVRDGKPVGRIRIESAGQKQATAKLIEGEARAGDHVQVNADHHGHGETRDPLEPDLTREELRRLEREASSGKNLDFVASNFLGVVAELEHPVPVAASCHLGVLVKRVIQGSPAEKARIRAGDRVIGIDDRVVRTPSEIHRAVKRRSADYVKVTVVRDDILQTVSADFRK